MRRPSLTAPLAALALLVGGLLLPTGSATATVTSTIATTMTRVVIAGEQNPIAGETPYGPLVMVRTTSGGDPVPNVRVDLWVKRVGQSAYTKVAFTHTDGNGLAQPLATLKKNSYLYVTFPGDDFYGPSHIDPVLTYVSTAGTMRVNDSTLRIGERLVVRGKTFPVKPGRRVVLCLGRKPFPGASDSSTAIARARVRADGTYRITKRFSSAGRKRLFVRLPGGDGNVTGYTRYRRVRVG